MMYMFPYWGLCSSLLTAMPLTYASPFAWVLSLAAWHSFVVMVQWSVLVVLLASDPALVVSISLMGPVYVSAWALVVQARSVMRTRRMAGRVRVGWGGSKWWCVVWVVLICLFPSGLL